MSSILAICFFPAFRPAASGGELRLSNLYREVSRYHDVTLITSTDFGARFEEIDHTPRFRELRFPKDEFWRNAYATLERSEVQGDLAGLAFALAVSDVRCPLRIRAHDLAATCDYVIHEFPYSEPIFSDGFECTEIYNSHNFEASLLSSIVRGEGFESALLKLIRLEGNLISRCQRVFATSRADTEKFRLFYGAGSGKLAICPNGVDAQELQSIFEIRTAKNPVMASRPRILFTGSGHYPNVEAARFLLRLATELPECDLVLAGGLCSSLSADVCPANVKLSGPFSDAEKRKLLTEADLFLNPVVLGSGTSLKALESLGIGLPMVSTMEGVRGLEVVTGVHCEIVARESFAAAVRRRLADREQTNSIALAGRAHVSKRYSWEQIAKDFSTDLDRLRECDESQAAVSADRPMVLALNDYSVIEQRSGGATRVRQLLAQIDCDVVLISFGSTFDVCYMVPGFVHITVPKTSAHRALESAANASQPVSVNDAIASFFVAANRILSSLVAALLPRIRAVIFEHPYMAPALDAIHAARPELPIVYSAHNVEGSHKAAILINHAQGATLKEFIGAVEERLALDADLIVCCTESDARCFQELNGNVLVVPNGCTIPVDLAVQRTQAHPSGQPITRVGFLGSAHSPNVEAARFIVGELASAFPTVHFELVGGVCSALTGVKATNITLHGLVNEEQKTSILRDWDIALNPVISGGGSSLKLPDYLAHGLATLSTPEGARGFAVAERQAGRLVPRAEFAAALASMLHDLSSLAKERTNAYRYAVEQLSWTVVTLAYRQRLRQLLAPQVPVRDDTRLLVVTYRYTEPALGGAEEYLIEVLKRLRPRFARIELAAIDTGHLTNRQHFGCTVENLDGGAALRVGEMFDQAHFFPPDIVPDTQLLQYSQELERQWHQEEAVLFRGFLDVLVSQERVRVFAGFYHPEIHERSLRRWTAPEFSFLVPSVARVFQMTGSVPKASTLYAVMLRLLPNGQVEVLHRAEKVLSPKFNIALSLPVSPSEWPVLLSCHVAEHLEPGDHRPLGVLLDDVSALIDRERPRVDGEVGMNALETDRVDLRELHEEELRSSHLKEWVRALRDNALNRNADTEAAFAAVRGPHSSAMQAWLARHFGKYDLVLVQGIPFDVVPSTIETLADVANRPRLAILPHFHGDDRFYHWRRYFRAFSKADVTLLFSSMMAQQLASIGNFTVVPGGGVRSDEYLDPTAARRFRQVHGSHEPFFLLLGRKIGSKGYHRVIHAHQALRRAGVQVSLVMIGPDEDKVPMSGDGIYYLGRQPRDVVRGALRCCLSLVTMSSSESFGIAICEAWLFGKPVIANRACGAFQELVRHAETGLLVATDLELESAMRLLVERPDESARMGSAGFDAAIKSYTWDKTAEALLSALRVRREDLRRPDDELSLQGVPL
jgi:glycosyltransferase involved in cell wall biosynthesis